MRFKHTVNNPEFNNVIRDELKDDDTLFANVERIYLTASVLFEPQILQIFPFFISVWGHLRLKPLHLGTVCAVVSLDFRFYLCPVQVFDFLIYNIVE